MAIVGGFTTLARYKAEYLVATSTSAADDAVIESLIESASRYIEGECYPRRFYATTETHYFDLPKGGNGRTLFLDDYLLTATTLTNGDATTIAATNCDSSAFIVFRSRSRNDRIESAFASASRSRLRTSASNS